MKYIDADLLIRKIKYQIRLENLNFAALGGGGQTFCINTLEWVLKQINSLQQEQPEVDLERDAVQFCFDKGFNLTPYQAKTIASHFYELGKNSK